MMLRIIADDFTFVTNNAHDFRRLHSREALHAGLVIIVPQVVPALQRVLPATVLDELGTADDALVSEVIEISLDEDEAVLTRYGLPP